MFQSNKIDSSIDMSNHTHEDTNNNASNRVYINDEIKNEIIRVRNIYVEELPFFKNSHTNDECIGKIT